MRAELLQETKENFAHIQIYILILAEETTYCTVEKERSKKSQEDKKKEDENVPGNLFKKWEPYTYVKGQTFLLESEEGVHQPL